MDKIKNYEMSIKITPRKKAKCYACHYYKKEMYIVRRNNASSYLCRDCMSTFLIMAGLMK